MVDQGNLGLTGGAAHIAALNEAADALLLCHDLAIDNSQEGPPVRLPQTGFDLTSITRLSDCLTLDQPVTHFPFSIPCGLVFSRSLIAACLEALPTWDFQRGADGTLCPAALIRTGRVPYLREQPGVYRIHGANEFASIVNGKYMPRVDPHNRAPGRNDSWCTGSTGRTRPRKDACWRCSTCAGASTWCVACRPRIACLPTIPAACCASAKR